MDVHHADLAAVGVEVVADLHQGVAGGAHGDHYILRVGGAVVVERLVVGAQLLVDLVHILDDHGGQLVVMGVAGLTDLEEDVGVLGRALDDGMVGVQGPGTEVGHSLLVHHLVQVGVIPDLDLLDLVRGPEAVEEVQERGRGVDGGQVSKAGAAAGHDVGVVTEDAQSMGGKGTRGNMHDAGEVLRSDLVHVGDHQQKTLGSGEGGGEGACHQAAVHRAGGAAFGLHFRHADSLAEQVLAVLCGPLIHMLGHDGRGSDGIDGSNVGKRIRHMGRGVVAVHGFEFSCQDNSSLYKIGGWIRCECAGRPRQETPRTRPLAVYSLYHKFAGVVNLPDWFFQNFAESHKDIRRPAGDPCEVA